MSVTRLERHQLVRHALYDQHKRQYAVVVFIRPYGGDLDIDGFRDLMREHKFVLGPRAALRWTVKVDDQRVEEFLRLLDAWVVMCYPEVAR